MFLCNTLWVNIRCLRLYNLAVVHVRRFRKILKNCSVIPPYRIAVASFEFRLADNPSCIRLGASNAVDGGCGPSFRVSCYLLLRSLPLSHVIFVPLLLTLLLLQTLWSSVYTPNIAVDHRFIDYRSISRLSVNRLRLLPSSIVRTLCSQRSAEGPFAHLSQTWALAFHGDMVFSGGGDSTDGDCTFTEWTVMAHVE